MSIRINPLDLIFQRFSAELEYALAGPISIELDPTYIFGNPGQSEDGYSSTGVGIRGGFGVWFQGHALRGWFLKGLAQYSHESYSATRTPDSFSQGWTSYGLLVGSQTVFGRDGGFTLSGGIGAMYTPNAPYQSLSVDTVNATSPVCSDHDTRSPGGLVVCVGPRTVDVIGQLALGYTF
jgi:hypothetical protein